MKTIIVLVLFAAIAQASYADEPIPMGPSETLRAHIENFRKQMPCGFPEENIPPLAPYNHPYETIDFGNFLFTIVASAFNVQIDGLNGFEINDVSLSLLSMKASYDFTWEQVKATGKYVIENFIFKLFKITGAGDINFTIRDLRIRGDLEMGVENDHMMLKNFNIVIALGDVESKLTGLLGGGPILNTIANWAIEDFIIFMIRDQSKLVSSLVKKQVVPMANEMLGEYTLKELLEMVTTPITPSTCGDDTVRMLPTLLQFLNYKV